MTELPDASRAGGPRGPHLTTGWEPDLPTDDTLLRRFVHGYADRTAAMAAAVGGRTGRDADAGYADLASPFLFDNAVVLLRPPSPAGFAAVLDRASGFFPPGRSWVLLSVFPVDAAAAAAGGLTLMGHPPLMVLPPGGTPDAPPSGLRIEPVRTEAELAVFRQVLLDGFGLPADQGTALADLRLVTDGPLNLFVGSTSDGPVACAGSAVHHGVVEVDWVATLPAGRRKGYGAALTRAAIDVAPHLPAVLIASDDGQPVYGRMGFMRLLRCTMWFRP